MRWNLNNRKSIRYDDNLIFWTHWSRGTEEKRGFSSFIKEGTDTGNPTGTDMMSPRDRSQTTWFTVRREWWLH